MERYNLWLWKKLGKLREFFSYYVATLDQEINEDDDDDDDDDDNE